MIEVVTFIGSVVKNEFFLGVCASLLAAILFPTISELGSALLAKLFGWLPIQGKTDLSNCTWRATFHVQSERLPPQVTDEEVKVRQFGNRIFVKFKTGPLEFQARGVIDGGRYVTGTWQDKTQGGYHGSFQLIIDPITRNMAGKWIGYSTLGIVKEGAWEWTRNTPNPALKRDAPKAARPLA